MVQRYYLVKDEFNPNKDYGIKIRPQYAKCLSILKKGDKINPQEFVKTHLNQFTSKVKSFKSNRDLIYHALSLGRKIGILQTLSQEETGYSISFENFRKLETVKFMTSQIRPSRYRNLKPYRDNGTASAYSYKLWQFNEWLYGKTFEFSTSEQHGTDTFKRTKKQIKLEGLEHFFKLYKDPYKVEQDFVRIIKLYLMDPKHKQKRAKTVKIDYSAIRAYFEKNDYPLNIRLDLKNIYHSTNGEDEQPSLNLEEVMKLLTVGKPNHTQKAVFLCKLHRGLDNSTFVDRFNFQVWEQLVNYFETENFTKWDLKKCPVPIKLTRMKTDFYHTGFLDVDAVSSIQEYLDYRRKKTGMEMTGGALFLNDRGDPISDLWIKTGFSKLRKNAGLDKILGGYAQNRYKVNPHEFRDLLKSTLIDAGTRPDLADHFIGHMPKDSYEKQATLYPDTLRKEYSKASKMLNIFSNFSNLVKGSQLTNELAERLSNLESELAKSRKRKQRTRSARSKN